MSENILARIFEHNKWANARIIEACAALADEQLDAAPATATRGSIRETLLHLVVSEGWYLNRLTGQERALDEKDAVGYAQ